MTLTTPTFGDGFPGDAARRELRREEARAARDREDRAVARRHATVLPASGHSPLRSVLLGALLGAVAYAGFGFYAQSARAVQMNDDAQRARLESLKMDHGCWDEVERRWIEDDC